MISKESQEKKKERADKLSITLPRNTLERMDEVRGDVSRSRFVYRSLTEYLSKKKLAILVMVMTAVFAAAETGQPIFAKVQTVQCADMTHGCGPGCDFGYHWNAGLQTCTPILNPNSSIQQPAKITAAAINCEKNDDGSWTCAPSDYKKDAEVDMI